MKFDITSTRDVINHRIDVQVNADTGEEISAVRTEMDSFTLAADNLAPTEVQYSRTFPQAGTGYSPGTNHSVKVTATNGKGTSQTASRQWTDS
jgi:hypothetical protein